MCIVVFNVVDECIITSLFEKTRVSAPTGAVLQIGNGCTSIITQTKPASRVEYRESMLFQLFLVEHVD
jgi:hypothetical protein